MINTDNLCFGQRIDSELGILEPWFSHGALDKIKEWDLSDKKILEWGGGSSTIYWATKCKEVYTIDANPQWAQNTIESLNEKGLSHKATVELRQINEGDQTRAEEYTKVPDGFEPDIVVIDGILRFECMQKALTLKRPLIMIVDNWMQDWIFYCPSAEKLMEGYKSEIYIQSNHIEHDGNCWKTAIFYL